MKRKWRVDFTAAEARVGGASVDIEADTVSMSGGVLAFYERRDEGEHDLLIAFGPTGWFQVEPVK